MAERFSRTVATDLGEGSASLRGVGDDQVRLLTIPARHPYVEAVRPHSATPVRSARVEGWAPDPFFDPGTVRAWADEIDVVHLHFGFEHLDPDGLDAWLWALDEAGLPLVYTAHDLRNPHHVYRIPHDGALDVLFATAGVVTTLTDGAAAELAARSRVRARVIPHPTLTDPSPRPTRHRPAELVPTERGLVGMHLKSLRTNLVDPVTLVRAAARGAADAGGRLRVDVHPEVADDPRLDGLRDDPSVEVVVHPRFDDAELTDYLRRVQVSVLPHRWGTHSGWLELCRDLGTTVVAPSCGYYREQWDAVVGYRNDEQHGLDADSLRDAVAEALNRPPTPPADPAVRRAEADGIRDAHARIYAELLAR